MLKWYFPLYHKDSLLGSKSIYSNSFSDSVGFVILTFSGGSNDSRSIYSLNNPGLISIFLSRPS